MIYFQLATLCLLWSVYARLKAMDKGKNDEKGEALHEAYQKGYQDGFQAGVASVSPLNEGNDNE